MTDTAKLTFNETWSVEDFMKSHEVTELDLAHNPESGKNFFKTNKRRVSGKVSNSLDESREVLISDVTSPEDGENFFIMHNRGTSKLEIKKTWTV